MTTFNKFLSGGGTVDLSDGTAVIVAASLSTSSLDPGLPCATDGSANIQTRKLDINDVNLIAGNPAIADLEMSYQNINNVKDIVVESTNNINTATIRYTGAANIIYDLEAESAGDVAGPASSTDNAMCRFDGTTGKVIKNGTVIVDDPGNFSGVQSITVLQDAQNNTKYGYTALDSVTSGDGNTCFGENAGTAITTGDRCCAFGMNALSQNVSGFNNNAFGERALLNCTGAGNNGFGRNAGDTISGGNNNVIIGEASGGNDHSNCVLIGTTAGSNLGGDGNVMIGASAGRFTGSGTNNTVVGTGALDKLSPINNSSNTIAIGADAGNLYEGASNNNICIGNVGVAAVETNTIRIGTSQTSCFISGIWQQTPSGGTETVIINSSGEIGSVASVASAYPPGFVSGGKLKFNTVSTVDVEAFYCRDDTDASNISKNSTTTVNIAVAGAGGLMTGQTEASDTTYEVYAIGDSNGVNADNVFLVPEGVTPVESGYDLFRYLGWVHNDLSSNFLNFYMTGKGSQRTIMYYESFVTMRVLNNGSSTTWANVVSSDSVAYFCGKGSGAVYLNVDFESDVAQNANVRFRPDGDTGDHTQIYAIQVGADMTAGSQTYFQIKVPLDTDGTRDLEYECSTGTLDVDVAVVGADFEL
jgi:hypothetical protein